MNRWIKAAIGKDVKDLEVHLEVKGKRRYILPQEVLSAKTLTSLKLYGCKLDNSNVIKLPNLQELSIKKARVDVEMIQSLIRCCSLLEDLRLINCTGLRSLHVSTLRKLNRIEVHECHGLKSVEIELLNLRTFWFYGKITHSQCKINLAGCENLRNLTLNNPFLTDESFHNLIAKFPFLEQLVLTECNKLERITILSRKLKRLALVRCKKLKEANIDAPNLFSFEYTGDKVPFSSMNISCIREAKLHIESVRWVKSKILRDVHSFLGKFNLVEGLKLVVLSDKYFVSHYSVLMCFSFDMVLKNATVHEELGGIEFAPCSDLKIELMKSSLNLKDHVISLLRACRPTTLSIISSPSSEFLKEPMGLPAKEILASKARSPKPFDAHTLRNRQVGWYFLTRRSKANANLFPRPPSFNHNWKERFLFVKLPKSQRGAVNNVWHPECDTRTCNMLKEKNLNETDLDHIEKLKAAEPLESKYPLSNNQLRECGIIFSLEEDSNEEEEGENDPGSMSSKGTHGSGGGSRVDSPFFNIQGVLGEIIPDELASVHGVDEGIQNLDFDVLTAEPQPKKPMTDKIVLGLTSKDKGKDQSKRKRVPLRAGTSSSARSDTPHRPDWNLSIEESVFKSPRTAWEWSSKGIIPMDRVTLSGYDISHTANGMVQLTSQALAQVQIGAEKLIATEKVLDEERKLVQVENNFRREAEKKVEDLTRALQKVKLSEASIAARVERLEAKKTKIGLNAVQSFKRSKVYTDHRLHDSKRALVYGYNTCKKDILKDYSDMDLSIYEHKYAREVAADESNQREEAEARVISQATANPTSSTSRSLGMSGAASIVVTVTQHMEIEVGLPRDTEMDASHKAVE
ncbi:hypothetical protein RJ639_039918 [Escallonia herrerae]|uniref:At1g61320/AtMIF1 LRR domain-containing protein n=1 Tax=Escallonia herrerae TaxID=1293975 RepID=A0AA88WMA1_9ASTE|nr:hypothetical protein RJ639_039918 [Escallonia herrerae]